jgi:hypothetical protein
MLDAGIEHRFRYFAEQAFAAKAMEPELWRPFLQNVWARGSRQGVEEARAYVHERREDGLLDEDLERRMLQLIRDHSTMR